jgi:hypothetical protein
MQRVATRFFFAQNMLFTIQAGQFEKKIYKIRLLSPE